MSKHKFVAWMKLKCNRSNGAPQAPNCGVTACCVNEQELTRILQKDLNFMGNILSATKYRVSPEGVSLMDETNNLVMQLGRSPADKL